ncbi:MAG: hypothetical protein E8D40_01670 [Nitrospira sp.]|jgi:hypothetical protein|nr:MAG: hypothetical protein E8D48_16315 [Nitrospira sp.]TKB94226.1 MAG: hypothetical protein E8D40_01670 [Nitrospira sp.]
MSVYTVKIALVVYGLLACFFIFLLWRNASAPDALKNTGVVLASILPIALLVLPYLSPEKIEERSTHMLLFDSEQKTLILGKEPNNYFSAYIPMYANLSNLEGALAGETFSEFMGEKGKDLIERGILEALLLRFSSGWDIGPVSKFKGPSGLSTQYYMSPGTSTAKTEISLLQLQNIFNHNRLISHPGVVVMPKLVLPPDCTLQTEQSGHERTIKITNQKLSVQIRITPQMGVVQQRGIWGVQPPDPMNMNRYSSIFFLVSIVGEIGRTWTYSPEMTTYRRWFDNISDGLSAYDWERIDKDIHDAVFRESMTKLLDP